MFSFPLQISVNIFDLFYILLSVFYYNLIYTIRLIIVNVFKWVSKVNASRLLG